MCTAVDDSVKCKQTEVNTYTLNSLACVVSATASEVMFSGWRKVSRVSIPAWRVSQVKPH